MKTDVVFEHELEPLKIEPGMRWITLRLKNQSALPVTNMTVWLFSKDTDCITVRGAGHHEPEIVPGDQRFFPFHIAAVRSGEVRVSVNGTLEGEPFRWESPPMAVTVGDCVAELRELYVLTQPPSSGRQAIKCGAVVRSLARPSRLTLEFWAETPSGEVIEIARQKCTTGDLGQERTCIAELEPDEPGLYTIHAYLSHEDRLIGHRLELVYAREANAEKHTAALRF